MSTDPITPDVDVLIVGAGLSGIGAACHLQTEAPGTTYEIHEARAVSGGTWDVFRYPGVRSDSDMFTLGYRFRPWTGKKSIAGGQDILDYLRETAAEYGVDDDIRYHSRVVAAQWSSARACWTATIENTESGERSTRTCRFLYLCSGYYRYDEGFTPSWPGRADFRGRVVHPQFWPEDLDVTGREVVVVGSGATAVTLVPALAESAEKVTMLQRSPSYLLPLPASDPVGRLLRRFLSPQRASRAIRWKNVRTSTAMYEYCRKHPARARAMLRKAAIKRLPDGFDVDRHFKPAYQPWDQRMCLVPDGDFFASVRSGTADVVTDTIESFTERGLRLASGRELPADVVVTATGLNLAPLSGMALEVDGDEVDPATRFAYKAMMLDGVPNLAFAMGYTNASWTLKVDLVSSFVARLMAHLRRTGTHVVTPRLPSESMAATPFVEMTSGYFERSRDSLPLQGTSAPWRVQQNYLKDAALFTGPVDADALEFTRNRELQPQS